MTGRAVVQESATVKYIETTLASAPAEMDHLLRNLDFDFFCRNDGSAPEISVERRTKTVRAFLERYFGIPAVWEVEASATPGAGSASSSAAQERPAG
ncbi:hypothetical protein BH10ACT7_BH10ACT7_18410 [soil metagenome]